MRALAVAAVIVYHEGAHTTSRPIALFLPTGAIGVDVFFAISGFLITTLLLQEWRRRGTIHFRSFYARRARRLLPALVTLLVTFVAIALVDQRGASQHRTLVNASLSLFYVANWVTALTHHDMMEFGHIWSLATEEQFYLVWPVALAILLWSGVRGRGIALLLGTLGAISAAWPQIAVSRHWSVQHIYYGPETRGVGLLLGSALGAAWVFDCLPHLRAIRLIRRCAASLGCLWVGLLMHSPVGLERIASVTGIGLPRLGLEEYSITAAVSVLLIWELLGSERHIGHAILSWAPLVAVGRISYGLYLWSLPITWELTAQRTGIRDPWILLIVHVTIATLAAGASWLLIERRFRAPERSGRSSPQRVQALTGLA